MISISTILKHYKREDIQKEIINNAQNREVAVKFGDKGFGKRPDVLKYPADILELAKQGSTSFHASEERWSNPLRLDPRLKRTELESMRIGWDLLIDIDCPIFEYSRIAADLVIKVLRHHNIKSISCKFSGNKGFHIGVPFEAFPEKVYGQETRLLFPEGPKRIALYIAERIKKPLGEMILSMDSIDKVIEKTKKKHSEIVKDGKFNPLSFLEIDTLLISSRHLYRMPFSLHEKSGLVSMPINPEKVMLFKKEFALPENIKISKYRFLDRENIIKNEAKQLIVEAFDFNAKIEEQKESEPKEYEDIKEAIPEKFFPPCIKKILAGLEDGKKRSLFILVNFLNSVGWSYDEIEKLLREWNKRNAEPLREVYLIGQLRYHKQQRKKILPPNCANSTYYKDLRVCIPDNLCPKIKNPVNYSRRKSLYRAKKQ